MVHKQGCQKSWCGDCSQLKKNMIVWHISKIFRPVFGKTTEISSTFRSRITTLLRIKNSPSNGACSRKLKILQQWEKWQLVFCDCLRVTFVTNLGNRKPFEGAHYASILARFENEMPEECSCFQLGKHFRSWLRKRSFICRCGCEIWWSYRSYLLDIPPTCLISLLGTTIWKNGNRYAYIVSIHHYYNSKKINRLQQRWTKC